jgi:hypothetical protein
VNGLGGFDEADSVSCGVPLENSLIGFAALNMAVGA